MVVHAAHPQPQAVNRRESIERSLAALADPTRRRVIESLRRQPRRAGELAASLSLSPSRMSMHLRVLRHSGLVEEHSLDHDARVRVYRLRQEPFTALRRWLEEVESFWTLQLDAFKTHVERKRVRRKL